MNCGLYIDLYPVDTRDYAVSPSNSVLWRLLCREVSLCKNLIRPLNAEEVAELLAQAHLLGGNHLPVLNVIAFSTAFAAFTRP